MSAVLALGKARSDSFASSGVDVDCGGRPPALCATARQVPVPEEAWKSAHRQAAAWPAALGTGGARRTQTFAFADSEMIRRRAARLHG